MGEYLKREWHIGPVSISRSAYNFILLDLTQKLIMGNDPAGVLWMQWFLATLKSQGYEVTKINNAK